MSAIDQHRELNSRRATERGNGVHGRTHRSASKQDVIDNDDGFRFQWKRQVGRSHHRQLRARADIIAVHRYIDRTDSNGSFLDRGDCLSDAPGDFVPAREVLRPGYLVNLFRLPPARSPLTDA